MHDTGILPCRRVSTQAGPGSIKPVVIQLPPVDVPCRDIIAEGRIILVGARRGSPELAALRQRLQTVGESGKPRIPASSISPKHSLPKRDGAVGVKLLYCGRLVLSMSGPPVAFLTSSSVFPGGELQPEKFSVVENPPARSKAEPGREYLVIVQSPPLDALEVSVNGRVPGEVNDLITAPAWPAGSAGSWAQLLAMEGGWAVGGILALREIKHMRERWANGAIAGVAR